MRSKITAFIMHHRQGVVLFVIALVLLIEVSEHIIIRSMGEGAHLWFDALVYALLFPVLMWMMLNLLDRSEASRAQTAQELLLRSQFSEQLGKASSWDELMERIVLFAHQVCPHSRATLFLFRPGAQRMEPEVLCTPDGQVILQPGLAPSGGLHPYRFDLPVLRGDHQIGTLRLELIPGTSLLPDSVHSLKLALPVIAMALEGALFQLQISEQAAASEAQRSHIAQNLHDSLAQNIGYLRLKLDQLTGENGEQEIGSVLQELERMRATADEAYQQVRSTLDELNPVLPEDLSEALIKQARSICTRANLQLRVNQAGLPYPLPPASRQQLHFILREALHNIEKHACASQVMLQILWLEEELIIKLTDDGVGFRPQPVSSDGHYGLWIMDRRAQDIGGSLKIGPADGKGTEVTIWLPVSYHAEGHLSSPMQSRQ